MGKVVKAELEHIKIRFVIQYQVLHYYIHLESKHDIGMDNLC